MFNTEYHLDSPTSIRGYVTDSAIVSPENTLLTGERDQYQITIEPENPYSIDDLEQMFRLEGHPHLEHKGDWKQSPSLLTFKSLIKPRTEKEVSEFSAGQLVRVDFRPMLNVMDANAFETLVLISVTKAAEEFIYEDAPSEAEAKYGQLDF